jgi:hypothetical protein
MEALVFLADAIAIVILVITSLRNDKRQPGEPMIGIFRYLETVDRAPKAQRQPAYLQKDER